MATGDEMLRELRVRMDCIEHPWVAFIGGVTLRRSEHCERGAMFACDPLATGLGRELNRLSAIAASHGLPNAPEPLCQFVVVHVDDVETWRSAIATLTGRAVGDGELAAALYWMAHNGLAARERTRG